MIASYSASDYGQKITETNLARLDILQGQALFIRVKQKLLFHFLTTPIDRQTDKKELQAEKTDKQK